LELFNERSNPMTMWTPVRDKTGQPVTLPADDAVDLVTRANRQPGNGEIWIAAAHPANAAKALIFRNFSYWPREQNQ
jgi:hypothetical protein